ncbi:kell blood group glycoprotein [Scomber japonicus]|uniref:kell blood group glycoprotein n=1 Tax=Scomber japonicus TaxID=13676 RepID=UPI0023063258|nr:kell blood group glycoprotein [Scomber japonicus]
MLRMSETPIELEPQLSVQPLSQPEPERGLQPPLLSQLPVPTQGPSEAQQQAQPQPELQQLELESNTEQQLGNGANSLWIKRQRLLSLLFLLFCLCAASLGLIYYMHHQSGSYHQEGAVTCLSSACQRASVRLSMSADPFTQPCDYFLFSCGSDRLSVDNGGRQRGHGIPGHPQYQRENTMWSKRRRQSEEREDRGQREGKILDRKTVLLQYLSEILESNDTTTNLAVQKAKVFYHSCLDTKSIEDAGAEPFLKLIQKLGGWAVSGQFNQNDFNATLSLLMRDYATFPFFNLYVGKDPNDGTAKRYIQIDQPDLLIPIEWNNRTEKSRSNAQMLFPFLESCQKYVALLGAPQNTRMIHVGMFISLSSELAVASSPLPYRLSKGQLHQRMTIKELQSQSPAIDWLRCLQAAFHPLHLTEDDHVLLHNLPYIVQMSRIINKWLNRPNLGTSDPLHTFMVLNLLHTLIPAMDSRFSEIKAMGNSEEEPPRWKHCVLETERGFDTVLTHLLRDRTEHREAEKIIQNIFSSLKPTLHELSWADQKSMKKAESLIPRLWATKKITDKAELELLFSKVSVSAHTFFSNYVQLLSMRQKRRNKLLTEEDEAVDILSITPFRRSDELIFPLGMFAPPLFHPTYPRAMNYGVIGFLIAKDILHLLLPDVYAHSESVHAVGECVWAHYLTVTEKAGTGGAFSLSAAQQQEVWVQYSALKIALQAYHQSLLNNPSDTSISGISHTRLFLTSFSQVNCDSDTYHEFMPLEPSFLITAICAKSHLCPTSLECPNKTQQDLLQKC